MRSRIEQTIRAGEAQWAQGEETDKRKGKEVLEEGKEGLNVVEKTGGEVVVDGDKEVAGGVSETLEETDDVTDPRVLMPEKGGDGVVGKDKAGETGGVGEESEGHVREREPQRGSATGEWEDSVELAEEASAPATRKG